ncbi:hypothetical protein ACEPUD_34675, partial [Burkholderia ubonensis]
LRFPLDMQLERLQGRTECGFTMPSLIGMYRIIDVANAFEANRRNQRGMVLLYATNAIAEIYVGGYTVFAGINLIFRLGRVFAGFNPVVLWFTFAILIISVIIEIEKDPPTMDWVRQCLWGRENNYRDATEEMDNFNKALNG